MMTPGNRIMIFIDGNYFQRNVKELYPDRKVVHHVLSKRFVDYLIRNYFSYSLVPDFIRMYYYDAIPTDTTVETPEHKLLLNEFRNMDSCEVRTGRVKSDGSGRPRQKGVDTLIALDMLSKAYENHYDIAILIAGDDDFLDIVNAVKNAGKRVAGGYFEKHISDALRQSFDFKMSLDYRFFNNPSDRVFHDQPELGGGK